MGVVRLRSSLSWSVAVHLVIILCWAAVIYKQAPQSAPRTVSWIEVEPVAKPERREQPQAEPNSNRVVQTTAGRKTESPAPDAFLGKQTQVVDQQTVSESPLSADAGNTGTKTKTVPESRAQQRTAGQLRAEKRGAVLSKFGVPIMSDLDDGKETLTRDGEPDDRMWMVGGTALAQDYVKGLKASEKTALNTREYVFYGYFERIRHRLDLAWNRVLRDQLVKYYRGGRQLASDMDHTTRLLVTLDAGGEVVKVQIIEESGTRLLDEAATRAFNNAGPFPNPPKGLVDSKGTIDIRWDFVLKT